MSESDDVAPDLDIAAPTTVPTPVPTTVRTGHPGVDGVLASMDTVGGLPVADHVAVFEQAHDQLRAALAGADDVPPVSPPVPSPSA